MTGPWSPRTHHEGVGGTSATTSLSPRATRVSRVDEGLTTRLDRTTLESAVEEVPDDFLSERDRDALRRRRAAYVAFLWKRLKSPRPFVHADDPAAP